MDPAQNLMMPVNEPNVIRSPVILKSSKYKDPQDLRSKLQTLNKWATELMQNSTSKDPKLEKLFEEFTVINASRMLEIQNYEETLLKVK